MMPETLKGTLPLARARTIFPAGKKPLAPRGTKFFFPLLSPDFASQAGLHVSMHPPFNSKAKTPAELGISDQWNRKPG
jgi:hypothetical protein